MFQKPQNIYGKATFMGYWERKRFLNTSNKGLVIDGIHRISQQLSFTHCLVAAPSGRGKTSRFVIPNVLRANGQSLVITDPAGEVFHSCKNYLLAKGYAIKTLNVEDLTHSDRYNPLFRANSHSSLRKLSDMLVENALQSNGSDPFWNQSATALITLLFKCQKKMPSAKQTLSETYRLLNLLLSDQDKVTALMRIHLDGDSLNEYLGFVKQDKTVSSIAATAKAALHKFSDPKIGTLTGVDTIDIESLRETPTALFLMIPDKDASSLMFLLTIFYTQLFSFCMTPPASPMAPYLPIYMLLDEFGNLGKIPNFATVITTLRKWQVSITLLLQDMRQISKVYGKDDLSIIANGGCSSRLFFPGLNIETCQMIERMLGQRTVVRRKYDPASWDLIGQRDDFHEIGRPLMSAQEISQMKDNQALFLHANRKPVMVKTTPWFKQSELKKRKK